MTLKWHMHENYQNDWGLMTAICCNQCFETIAKTDSRAARLWLDLCACFVKFEGNFKLMEHRIPWMIPQFLNLEKKNFIETCDGFDGVAVRVNGYDIIEVPEEVLCLETFCIDREAHKSAWV